jgi:hypothetical protein
VHTPHAEPIPGQKQFVSPRLPAQLPCWVSPFTQAPTLRSSAKQQARWPSHPHGVISAQIPIEETIPHLQASAPRMLEQLPFSTSPGSQAGLPSERQQARSFFSPQSGALHTPLAEPIPGQKQFAAPRLLAQLPCSLSPSSQAPMLRSSRKQQARWPFPPHGVISAQIPHAYPTPGHLQAAEPRVLEQSPFWTSPLLQAPKLASRKQQAR